MPEGFSAFCTIKEAGIIKKNQKNKLKIKEEKIDKENISIIEEPLPNEIHKYCHICKKAFDNYIGHINCKMHKENISKYSNKFNDIKNIFKRINTFWENEKNNRDKNTEKKYKKIAL